MKARPTRVYVPAGELMPGIDDIIAASATSPDTHAKLLARAGFTNAVRRLQQEDPLDRARASYQEMHRLGAWRRHFSRRTSRAFYEGALIPEGEALAAVIKADDSNIFSTIEVWEHPLSGETAIVGRLRHGDQNHHFLIAQWGPKISRFPLITVRGHTLPGDAPAGERLWWGLLAAALSLVVVSLFVPWLGPLMSLACAVHGAYSVYLYGRVRFASTTFIVLNLMFSLASLIVHLT